MIKQVKRAARRLICGPRIHQVRKTDAADILALLQRIRPVVCPELIRVGPDGDGGYLVPNDLDGIEACFSPGVDQISGFETQCADRGMRVFLADHSVERPPDTHGLFHFTRKYVGVTTNASFMTLDGWVDAALPGSDGDLLLQMDIEGFEYEVLLAASDRLMQRFRVVVVEFHQLDQVWNKPFFRLWSRVFDKLLQTHYCVHNHPNNYYGTVKRNGIEVPYLTEMTFYRRDRLADPAPAPVQSFPHPLDRDNADNPSVPLPRCWYRPDPE
ncbi:MAG: FkbM family methyltransferase [Planctomycetota bacterium]